MDSNCHAGWCVIGAVQVNRLGEWPYVDRLAKALEYVYVDLHQSQAMIVKTAAENTPKRTSIRQKLHRKHTLPSRIGEAPAVSGAPRAFALGAILLLFRLLLRSTGQFIGHVVGVVDIAKALDDALRMHRHCPGLPFRVGEVQDQ